MEAYGSLVNRILESGKIPDVKVGDGATIVMWSDRIACTIIDIRYYQTGKRAGEISAVTLQEDTVSGAETTPNPDGAVRTIKRTPKGWGDYGLLLGKRDPYTDPSF